MDHRVEIRLWLHPPLTLRNACATQKTMQFVHLKKINAIRHSRTNLQMVPLLTLIANSLLHFFSISLCKINQHTEPCPYIISFNGRKYETASSELAFRKESITSELSNRFVFSNSVRILKNIPFSVNRSKAETCPVRTKYWS